MIYSCSKMQRAGPFTVVSMLSRLPFRPRAFLLKLMRSVASVLVYWMVLKHLVGDITCFG